MNKIHPTAIIGNNVKLGSNNTIGAYTIIEGFVEIGDSNTISSHVVIGCSATDTKKTDNNFENSKVIIGNRNEIREFCIIEQPCYENLTIIRDDVFIMQGAHISHDSLIDSHAVVTNTSVIAGIVKVLKGANIAMGCTINQYTVIGHYSIVATGSACMKNVKPFSRYIPNKSISVNTYAIKKYGFVEFESEITEYVMNDIYPSSTVVRLIIDEFNQWVSIYGRDTY